MFRVADPEPELEEDRQVIPPLRVDVIRDVAKSEFLHGRLECGLECLIGLSLEEEVGVGAEPEPLVGRKADVSPQGRFGRLAPGRLGGRAASKSKPRDIARRDRFERTGGPAQRANRPSPTRGDGPAVERPGPQAELDCNLHRPDAVRRSTRDAYSPNSSHRLSIAATNFSIRAFCSNPTGFGKIAISLGPR